MIQLLKCLNREADVLPKKMLPITVRRFYNVNLLEKCLLARVHHVTDVIVVGPLFGQNKARRASGISFIYPSMVWIQPEGQWINASHYNTPDLSDHVSLRI